MILILSYIMAGITLAGSIFNARKMRIGFCLWSITNGFWIVRNMMIGEYAQAVVYAANLCISIYGFIKWRKPSMHNIDKFYVRKNQGLITWVYYNPDSASKGQYVFIEFDMSLVEAAESNSYGTEEFFDYINEHSKMYLIDKGTADFKCADREHHKKPADLTNCTDDTMMSLIEMAHKYLRIGEKHE